MKNIIFIVILSIVSWNLIYSQHCPTSNPADPSVLVPTDCSSSIGGDKTVKLYFHVWGNEDIALLDQAVENVNDYFQGTGFDFFYDRCDVIYYDGPMGNNICDYQNVNRREDGINVHLIGALINIALAESIPGKAILVGGEIGNQPRMLQVTLAHEIGHCLGLFHTHHNSAPEPFMPCNESCFTVFDGSHLPEDVGDCVLDTNPDPAVPGEFGIRTGCMNDNYFENDIVTYSDNFCGVFKSFSRDPMDFESYLPPIDNIMSSYGACRLKFTACQAVRMHELVPQEIVNSNSSNCQCGNRVLPDMSDVTDLRGLYPNQDLSMVTDEILIEGTFVVNDNLVLPPTLNLFMSDGAKIVVEESWSFTKRGGFIIACNEQFNSDDLTAS